MCWRVVELVVLWTAAEKRGPLVTGVGTTSHSGSLCYILNIVFTVCMKYQR